MAWTKMKTAAVAAAAVILAGGTTVTVVQHYRTHSLIFSWTRELTDGDNARFVRLTGTTPAQVAKTFFDACSQEDWTEAGKYWPPGFHVTATNSIPDDLKKTYGGMEIISLGKPFKGRISIAKLIALQPNLRSQFSSTKGDFETASVFVPYEIRLKDGTIKKWQLSIRCDNPESRWYWDGGL